MLKLVLKWLFASIFIGAGILHFLRTNSFEKIMPPYLPWHRELVYLSGVVEIALGVLLLIPAWTPCAAWGLIALLIAVFPANIQMALDAEAFPGISPVLIWLRLPLQGLLIAWAYWFTRRGQ